MLESKKYTFKSYKLRSIIKNAGKTSDQFSKELDIHPVTFFRWINEPPNLESLISILIAAGFTSEELAAVRISDFYVFDASDANEEFSGIPVRFINYS